MSDLSIERPFDGFRAAVTGGTSGLGLALVRAMRARGAEVAFVARRAERVREVARELLGTHGIVGDVSRKHETHPIALQITAALATNLVGPFRLTKALLGALAASAREGRPALVVNVTSDAAVTPYPGWGAYGASKAALSHLSKIWDEELRPHGVRLLAIDPGDMDTPLHALAVPDADPSTLKRPVEAVREIVERIEELVEGRTSDATRGVAGPAAA